ncbi:GAF and ANTAR domain-containing protein [Nakamurella sp. GG22]
MIKSREQDIIDSFSSLTDRVVGNMDVLELTAELAQDCARLLDVAAAGLLLADAGGVLHLLAATSEEARNLELFMLQRDEGPCLDCYHTGAAVSVADLSTQTARWPRFTAAAADQGFASVHAIPMLLRGDTLGALGLFGTTPGALGETDLALAQGLAHVASIAIVQSTSRADRDEVLPALHAAITSRAVVETAKGVLAHVHGLTMQEAFAALRDTARNQDRLLADIAREVIANDPPTSRQLGGRSSASPGPTIEP